MCENILYYRAFIKILSFFKWYSQGDICRDALKKTAKFNLDSFALTVMDHRRVPQGWQPDLLWSKKIPGEIDAINFSQQS